MGAHGVDLSYRLNHRWAARREGIGISIIVTVFVAPWRVARWLVALGDRQRPRHRWGGDLVI